MSETPRRIKNSDDIAGRDGVITPHVFDFPDPNDITLSPSPSGLFSVDQYEGFDRVTHNLVWYEQSPTAGKKKR